MPHRHHVDTPCNILHGLIRLKACDVFHGFLRFIRCYTIGQFHQYMRTSSHRFLNEQYGIGRFLQKNLLNLFRMTLLIEIEHQSFQRFQRICR